jgi:hypothetical protein
LRFLDELGAPADRALAQEHLPLKLREKPTPWSELANGVGMLAATKRRRARCLPMETCNDAR